MSEKIKRYFINIKWRFSIAEKKILAIIIFRQSFLVQIKKQNMKSKNKPPPKEIELFDSLVRKYGTGEKTEKKIIGYRNLCIVAPVKIFTSLKNGDEKNKAALFLHIDEEKNDYAIVFCSSFPRDDTKDRKLIEVRPSLESGEPNINFGETGHGSPRVMRIRSSHDEFAMRVRMIAFDIAKDINYLVHSLTHEEILMPEKETVKV